MVKKVQENLVKIIQILQNGEYHDGTRIGKTLNITRSAVWKTIKKLESIDVQIDTMKGKGYALKEPLILLDHDTIQKNIGMIDFHLFESIDSTNQFLKNFKNFKKITICMAEHQTSGRGRFNRTWHSPFGKNIYLSCLYPFQKDVSELAGLSLLVSLSVLSTLKKLGIDDAIKVKWSNDVMYANKKLCGNLIDVHAETHDNSCAIIGIGINVNMLPKDGELISQQWISLRQILNQYIDRNDLSIMLINDLMHYLRKFDGQGFSAFLDEWYANDLLLNKTISLKNLNDTYVGRVLGVNAQGHLLLSLPNGDTHAFSAGETTIVK